MNIIKALNDLTTCLANKPFIGLTLLLILLSLPAHAQQSTVTYLYQDALGSTIAAADESGNVLWREVYTPFGERLENAVSTDTQDIYYTGKSHDDETGLTYFGARHYDPVVGRFMSVDPVSALDASESNPMMFNRYAYANNNPYRYVDPDGRLPVDTIWDAANVVYDIGKIGVGYATGSPSLVAEGSIDLAADALAMVIPYVPAGASKVVGPGGKQFVAKGPGKRKYMDAIDGADGPHTVWKKNNKGEITNHQTFEPNTNPNNPNKWVKGNRTDVSGKSEFNKATKQWVDTPHTHDSLVPGGIRPANANELPKL